MGDLGMYQWQIVIVIIGLCSTEYQYHEHLHEGDSLQRSLFSMTEARWGKLTFAKPRSYF